eukprot:6838005-Alexandrium_andersonii.AAC.1
MADSTGYPQLWHLALGLQPRPKRGRRAQQKTRVRALLGCSRAAANVRRLASGMGLRGLMQP